MPITVKFSEQFYHKLGHEAVGELVDWFNAVDATYRGDLRELNEHNFARFDAKLEQRLTQLDAKLEQRATQLDARLEQRAAQLDARLEQRLTQVEERLGRRMADLRADLIKWMFLFWVGNFATTAGLMFALVHFTRP